MPFLAINGLKKMNKGGLPWAGKKEAIKGVRSRKGKEQRLALGCPERKKGKSSFSFVVLKRAKRGEQRGIDRRGKGLFTWPCF